MPSESHLYVYTWEKVAEYSPFYNNPEVKNPTRIVMERFGKEMLDLNVVQKGRKPGSLSSRHVVSGVVWRIDKYFHLKAIRGELYKSKKEKKAARALTRKDIEGKV